MLPSRVVSFVWQLGQCSATFKLCPTWLPVICPSLVQKSCVTGASLVAVKLLVGGTGVLTSVVVQVSMLRGGVGLLL